MILQKKILVVEDNQINRMMLREILSSNYQVLEAENGQDALFVLKSCKADISLILLDIIMPVMDGYTFLSIIKADPSYSSIPVIVATQSDGESDEVTALSNGATDFITKPYKPQVILHRVASIINLRETAAIINQFQYDRLTGLYSKEFFYQRVKEIFRQNPKQEYDIICSDIENFKLVNDIFGIPAGDRLLCGIADLYTRLTGERGICGRFNADQFVCLLERRQVYTNKALSKIIEEINTFSTAKSIVVKWGVYSIEDRSVSIEQMCDRAFLAVRSIKGQYGKHIAMYDDTLRGKLLREQTITDSMESALNEGQFVVYLQPKYRIRDHKLSSAEALIRWNHPKWGIQSPGEFIPLFEKNGFITKLDQFVWDRSCAILREWEDKGYSSIPISVNVSRADIYNADIADILIKIVQKYGLSPSRLHLEITESAYTENPNQILETVSQLRTLGFVIEMDDFGSGYSSLNMLNRMPIDILKLDMKFIQSETAKPVSHGILRFIMELAGSMGLSVVAEGVETREQLEYLRDTGCDYAQGYYFAKPMPFKDFESLIAMQTVATEEVNLDKKQDVQRTRTILIADEDARYRSEVRNLFEREYEIIEAANVDEVRNCISEHGRKIAAIILSLTLPKPDGFRVLEWLQREKVVWNVPVITVASAKLGLEEKALELGADDFVNKPHSQKVLWRRALRAMGFTEMRKRELILQDAAYQDYLTGLLNRRGLNAAITLLQERDTPAAVYIFDLDDLKGINDTLGHKTGDKLLKYFGACLRSHTRETDILARFGGDEFIVILKQIGSEENALKKGEEICIAVGQECCDLAIPLSCSAGVALWNIRDPIDAVIERADHALYYAKRRKKSGCQLWKE